MRVFTRTEAPTTAGDPRTFTGDVRIQKAAEAADGTPVVVYRVAFAEGGRTNWHAHSGTQWLFVLEGRIRVQAWGEAPRELAAGDAVAIAPREKHWHGAAPGAHGTHLAVNVDSTTEWMEPVSEEQYRGGTTSR